MERPVTGQGASGIALSWGEREVGLLLESNKGRNGNVWGEKDGERHAWRQR